MDNRAVAPVIGIVLLIVVSIVCAGVIVLFVTDIADLRSTPTVVIDGTVDTSENNITLVHTSGDDIPVDYLDLRITIDGVPMKYQPPVPFDSATGFSTGPSGPLHAWGDDTWSPQQESVIHLAGSNEPLPDPDSTVEVSITYDDRPIAEIVLDHA